MLTLFANETVECKEEIKNYGDALYEYCFGEYFDEGQDVRIKTDERHYYRAKMEFINLNGDFEKYYRFGISSTQTSEIINGAPDENWTLKRYKEMFEVMGELRCIKYAPYELDETIKPPRHGPFEKIFDSTSEKEIEVCLCKFCGKKSIHKVRGPPKNARIKSSTDLK